MNRISVIIPFFQREAGVLGKALRSIEAQAIPAMWQLQVVVVDDGSPLSAQQEVIGYDLTGPRTLRVVEQTNSGVGAARNHGLDIAVPISNAIAFLDSDDTWPADHVTRAITALDAGFDVYFTDNRRAGRHDSHIHSAHVPCTARLIAQSGRTSGIVELPHDQIVGLCLQELPCQASTVVYRTSTAPLLRFNPHLKSSGEDVLFFTELLSRSRRVGFDLDSTVECGNGVNIFFSNLGWDASGFLSIKADQLLTHRMLSKAGFLSARNSTINKKMIRMFSDELSFHLARSLIKHPRNALRQAWRLFQTDPIAGRMVLNGVPRAVVNRLRGRSAMGKVE